MPAQYLRPNSNVTQTDFTGGFAQIDEVSASDSDYAVGTVNTISTLEVGLSNPGAAVDLTRPVTIRYRASSFNSLGQPAGGPSLPDITCSVYEGATLRGLGATHDAALGFTTYSFEPDLSAVSDWNDVRLRFVTNAEPGRTVAISWAEVESNAIITFNETIAETATPGDSVAYTITFNATISESSEPGDIYIAASNANIHAFTRHIYGEIWFVLPIGDTTSHTYFTFCVDESAREQAPVWFKGGIDAAAAIDDGLLGEDAPWSCLRVPDAVSASIYSFDRRADGADDISWNLVSSAFYIEEGERRVMLKKFFKDFEQQDDTVTLKITTYDEPNGNVISNPSYSILSSDTREDFRASGMLMTMEFSGTGPWRLGKPAFEIVSLGER